MAKIDTSGIDGYESMSAEEKIAALEGYEIDDNAEKLGQMKAAFDRASKEAADWKKKHNQLLSDEERKTLETEQAVKDMQAELEQLRKEKAVTQYKANALAIGIGEKESETISVAIADGDFTKVFNEFGKFLKTHDHEIEVRLLQNTPTPPGGDGEKAITREDFKKLGMGERAKFALEHPEQYEELYKT